MCYSCEQMEAGAAILEGYHERMELQLHSELWETRSGELIKVSRMDSQHIRNCIAMLSKSNHPMANGWIDLFKEELKSRKNLRKEFQDAEKR